ncbi:hypothetical protein [Poseidonocella sedimentorum]|uniref:Thioredoxin-like domain-containing protein n=1 Tax=Poseidonocella sedimentorum TaxID=871652 RepID=A0A1I6DVE7_9RHOB|nr:hypothetical protein [Poseidonocella sedimentorum]SFR09337.1 hypothetical protein SAMN04515673_105217 [Poseidonocella sedimentorum]
MLKPLLLLLAMLLSFGAPGPAAAEPRLLMAEEVGCPWCARWNREIAPIYANTPEGRAAPLVRFDIHGPKPDVEFARSVRFTPTFILVDEGRELSRIEGYPGEDFFWGLLARMLVEARIPLEADS